MAKLKPVRAFSSTIGNVPQAKGQVIFVEDTYELFWDATDAKRVEIRDIVVLATEAERSATLAPLNKFYYVTATNILYRFDGAWHVVGDTAALNEHINNTTVHITAEERESWNSKASKSKTASATLSSSSWSGSGPYTQTITVSGLTTNAQIGLAESATTAQAESARNALLRVSSRSGTSVTITADGDKPEVNIPVGIIMWGD